MLGTVLVTGASTGIGAATVHRLADAGFHVFGSVRRTADDAAVERHGGTPVHLDVTDPPSIDRAVTAIETAMPSPDTPFHLVNNAGIPGAGPIEHLDLEEIRRVLEVNVLGMIAVTQRCLPRLARTHGRIVNLGSISGRLGMPFLAPYAASKFAVEGLSDCLRRELRLRGIDVILLEPGSVATPIWDKVEAFDSTPFRGTPYEGALARFRNRALHGGRGGMPAAAVAEAVHDVLTQRHPPARRLIAKSGWKLRLLTVLPDRWIDWLIHRSLAR